jgi:hypothetical protein
MAVLRGNGLSANVAAVESAVSLLRYFFASSLSFSLPATHVATHRSYDTAGRQWTSVDEKLFKINRLRDILDGTRCP